MVTPPQSGYEYYYTNIVFMLLLDVINLDLSLSLITGLADISNMLHRHLSTHIYNLLGRGDFKPQLINRTCRT